MIRAICLLVFLCTIGLARAQAQSGVITLTVVDAETGEEVPGAVIEIVPKAHPDQKKYYTSGYKGALQVRGLAYGSYTLAVTFMGYEKAEKTFQVVIHTLYATQIRFQVMLVGKVCILHFITCIALIFHYIIADFMTV